MPVQLCDIAMLVTEHAASTVHALLRMVEGPAVFGLELLIVAASGGLSKLFLTMSETTFVFISALCCFYPIFAQLCLVLSISVALDHHMIMLVVTTVDSTGTLGKAIAIILVDRLIIEGLSRVSYCCEVLEDCWLENTG